MIHDDVRAAAITALAQQIAAGDIDLVDDPDADAWDIQADHWTIRIEPSRAWIAVEQEPDRPADFPDHLAKVIGPRGSASLAELDQATGGQLGSLLEASSDPISVVLAALIRSDHSA